MSSRSDVTTITYVLPLDKLAYSIPEAADKASYSQDVLRKAIHRGELAAAYGTSSKPVILAEELLRWLKALPTEKP